MPPAARSELVQWIDNHLQEPEVELTPAIPPPEAVVYTDASEFGWGAVVTLSSGTAFTIGEQWTIEDRTSWNLASSVTAESLALVKAIQQIASVNSEHIRVFTDHMPLVYAFKRGYAKAYAYNWAILVLKNTFPKLELSVEWVKGILNVEADAISRGMKKPTDGSTETKEGGKEEEYGDYGIQATLVTRGPPNTACT